LKWGAAMELKVRDFESALKSLEDIVLQLENGDLTLDRALELFEEGINISRFCNSKLEEAERKVEILMKTGDGGIKEAPFSEEAEASE
jgi:exodeoxyribonuclease VII small subunit